MAPELLAGEGYDYLVDYWAIGCIAFEMMAGMVTRRFARVCGGLPAC